MARNGMTGMSPLACFQSRRHVYKSRSLRSTVSPFYLRGRLIWCPFMGSDGLRFVASRSAG
jgi:hypothetical protein